VTRKHECPLLAQSGHPELHRTCPLSGVKQTSTAHKRIHESAARFRCANADRCGGGSPSQICAGLRVSARWRASTSISRALISSGETLGATLVKDGRCLVPRRDMAQIRPRRAVYSVVGGGRSGGSHKSKNITVIFQLIRYCIGGTRSPSRTRLQSQIPC
jgi:hypothetical protein